MTFSTSRYIRRFLRIYNEQPQMLKFLHVLTLTYKGKSADINERGEQGCHYRERGTNVQPSNILMCSSCRRWSGSSKVNQLKLYAEHRMALAPPSAATCSSSKTHGKVTNLDLVRFISMRSSVARINQYGCFVRRPRQQFSDTRVSQTPIVRTLGSGAMGAA